MRKREFSSEHHRLIEGFKMSTVRSFRTTNIQSEEIFSKEERENFFLMIFENLYLAKFVLSVLS